MPGKFDSCRPLWGRYLVAKLEANNVPYIYAPFEGKFHAFDFSKTARGLYFIEKFLAEYL